MRRKRRDDFETEQRVSRLATYNSEVARGLMHTPEWRERMEREQHWYNEHYLQPLRIQP